VEVQGAVAGCDVDVPAGVKIEFRIGIHVGDIIIDDNDIFGDGVNIAARLEGIAQPGAVCISDDTHRQIRGKVDVAFEDIGEQALKNISEPMRAWQIKPAAGSVPAGCPVSARPRELALPDKHSIVVLPFDNMSAEPAQDFLADGIVEAITAALSCIRSFFVIARSSAFTYKGRVTDARSIGKELGVAYFARGQRAEGQQPPAYHGPAHRNRGRRACLEFALRRYRRRILRLTGSYHPADRWRPTTLHPSCGD
jgi:adenylate cyclase